MKKIILSIFICAGFIIGAFAQVPDASFSATPTTICAGKSVTWSNLTTGAGPITYSWGFPGATSPTSGSAAPAPRTYNLPGVYTVSVIATNGSGPDTLIKLNY